MEYRNYKLLNKTELFAIKRKLETAYEAWSSAWLTDVVPAQVGCHRAAEYQGDAALKRDVWKYVGVEPGQWIAVSFGSSFQSLLGASLASSGQGSIPARPSALLNDLAMRAVADLVRPLCPWVAESAAEKIVEGAGLPAQVWEAGSGALVAELTWGDERMEIVFSAAHVTAMLDTGKARSQSSVPFARTTDALLKERLTLKVLAGETQLELALLQTIVVGDVIKLNTRIDEPLQVLNADGTRLCNAFLGSYEGRKSIQLIA
jgi:flagellar motor switch/type III secretory pathway protein FliN